MAIEISEHDFRQIEDAVGEIKAAVVRLRMGTDEQKAYNRDFLLNGINFQANRIGTLLENGYLSKTAEVEARR
jgi:hypothetical protein